MLVAMLALLALAAELYQRFRGARGVGGEVAGIAQVIDGDSMRVGGRELRLKGIDAPEGRQTCERGGETWRCGEAAAEALRRMTRGARVNCAIEEIDRFERGLATCRVDGRDLNEAMVRDGFALAYGRYESEESAARAAKRGLWASKFERPRDWRRRNGVGQ
jgi:endonuclease YncB( thermonuclease family)